MDIGEKQKGDVDKDADGDISLPSLLYFCLITIISETNLIFRAKSFSPVERESAHE